MIAKLIDSIILGLNTLADKMQKKIQELEEKKAKKQ